MTPTEDLFMEVLAARHRLGENVWTFARAHLRTAKRLEDRGLIDWKHGVVEDTILAWMTDAGRAEYLSPTYTAPDA